MDDHGGWKGGADGWMDGWDRWVDGMDGADGKDRIDGMDGLDGIDFIDVRFLARSTAQKGLPLKTPLERRSLLLDSRGPRTGIIGRSRFDVFSWIKGAGVLPWFLVQKVFFGGEESDSYVVAEAPTKIG